MLGTIVEFIRSLFILTGMVANKSSFPPPLSQTREAELLNELKDGDADARSELIEHNLRLVAHIAKKYTTPQRTADDLISIGTIGLIKAVNTYNAEKARSFAGYASRCIENEMLMFIRSEKKYRNEVSLEESIGTDRDGNEITLRDIIASNDEPIIDSVITRAGGRTVREAVDSLLSAREKRVIILRFGLDDGLPKTQRETAKALGISRSYISRIEKRALIKLNSYLTEKL